MGLMLPNFSNLRVTSVDGKIPGALMGTPEERAFAWFMANREDENAQDPMTSDSLADGFDQTGSQWNDHFWFVRGELVTVSHEFPTDDEPRRDWFGATALVDVPVLWREPGPGSLIQVKPTKHGVPGEFAHKGSLLLMFAKQRRAFPDGILNRSGTRLFYPAAYRGPGGTASDFFIPTLTEHNGVEHTQMANILDRFLTECELIEITTTDTTLALKLYDREADRGRVLPLRNPFPTPWYIGNGQSATDYDENFTFSAQLSMIRPWWEQLSIGAPGDDALRLAVLRDEEANLDMGTYAVEDVNEIMITMNEWIADPVDSRLAKSEGERRLLYRLERMVMRWQDPEYAERIVGDGELWNVLESALTNLYVYFDTIADIYWMADQIILFFYNLSDNRTGSKFLRELIIENLRPIYQWINKGGFDPNMGTVLVDLLTRCCGKDINRNEDFANVVRAANNAVRQAAAAPHTHTRKFVRSAKSGTAPDDDPSRVMTGGKRKQPPRRRLFEDSAAYYRRLFEEDP